MTMPPGRRAPLTASRVFHGVSISRTTRSTEPGAKVCGRVSVRSPTVTDQFSGSPPKQTATMHVKLVATDSRRSKGWTLEVGQTDSCSPRHREDEVLVARAEDLEVHSPGVRYDDPLGAPDDVIVADEPLVRVEQLPGGEHERVHSPLGVGELDLFAAGQDARGTGSECLSHDESTLRW